MSSGATLHYVADPMCSWCWAFRDVLAAIVPRLAPGVSLRLVLGGLAPDSDAPMTAETRAMVQAAWRTIEARTDARFNHAFWELRTPRRSTWPACRAVLAAGERAEAMFAAIQRAYYVEARDPSDRGTLVDLARELGLDGVAFDRALDAPETQAALGEHLARSRGLGVDAFPSLVLERADKLAHVTRGWVDAGALEDALAAAGALAPQSVTGRPLGSSSTTSP